MGKNLKGRECGKGICQRKDGKYAARYTAKDGSRKEKHFDTLPEARNWLADAQYEDKHDVHNPSSEMTVDSWFEFWITHLIADLAPNTKRNYRERYRVNIQPVIGSMRLCDVKPMHCKIVLNKMEATYAGSTIRQAYIAMGTMFRAAVMNDMLIKHPMDGVRFSKPVRAVDDIKFLTVEEQAAFLETAKRSHNYRQYVLLLETGLRTSEMIGLTWDSIDWKKRTLTVSKTLEYRHSEGIWRAGPPKTNSSYRTIPLTTRAYDVLKSCYEERHTRKESELLSQILEYVDAKNYALVYSAPLTPGTSLEDIYTRFNIDHPKDFKGHSLSVSDVVVLHQNGQDTSHYVDSLGYKDVPEFLQPENYLKTAEQTTEQNYNMIDGQINNTPTAAELEEKAKAGEQISLAEYAEALKTDKGRGKPAKQEKPSIRAQLKAAKEQTPKKQARQKTQDLERS